MIPLHDDGHSHGDGEDDGGDDDDDDDDDDGGGVDDDGGVIYVRLDWVYFESLETQPLSGSSPRPRS